MIKVKVKPNKKVSRFLGEEKGVLIAEVSAPAVEGKANLALIRLFKKSGLKAEIVKGHTSRIKYVEIK